MAGGNHDTPLVGHHLTLGMGVESSCAGVHSRSKHVAFEAKNKFTNAVVGLGTDIAQLLLKIVCRPSLQAPVLIVDEDATKLNARQSADIVLRVVKHTLIGLIDRNIGKPIPRTYTYGLAHMQDAISQSASIGTSDKDVPVLGVDSIALPCTSQFAMKSCMLRRTDGNKGTFGLACVHLGPRA